MRFSHACDESSGTPTPLHPTDNRQRRAIALSLLNQREPSDMLNRLVIAAMQGSGVYELALLEAAG